MYKGFFDWDKLLERDKRENGDEEKEEELRDGSIAEYVPHPDGEGYACDFCMIRFLSTLSQEDMNQLEE